MNKREKEKENAMNDGEKRSSRSGTSSNDVDMKDNTDHRSSFSSLAAAATSLRNKPSQLQLAATDGTTTRSQALALLKRKKKHFRRRYLDPLASTRPASCPPIIVHHETPPLLSASVSAWPAWFAAMASPRAKEGQYRGMTGQQTMHFPPSYQQPQLLTANSAGSALSMSSHAAAAGGPLATSSSFMSTTHFYTPIRSAAAPTLYRSVTSHPISFLSAASSAPNTPASGLLLRDFIIRVISPITHQQ